MEQKNEMTVAPQDLMMQTLLNPAIFEQMQRGAKLFSESGLVPKTFERNPAACFVGLQLAAQLGVNPFMLFQKIYSVQGKIGIETQIAVAVANQRGVFLGPIEHEFSGEGKTRSCKATATLTKSGKAVSMVVDWATVEAEGWASKPGSKWKTMPDQMFRYRTSLWLIRTYAPEVLMGLYGSEELEDSRTIDITPPSPLAEKLKKAKEIKETKEVAPEVITPEKPSDIPLAEKLKKRATPDPKVGPKPLTPAQEIIKALDHATLARARGATNIATSLESLSDAECSAIIDVAETIEAEQKEMPI
jgi:hypothetical protein